MFRELLSFCITSIERSGSYSLRVTECGGVTRLFGHFWADNSLYGLCIGVFPGRLCPPGSLLSLLSGFFALVEKDVHLLFLTGFDPRITWTVSRVLPQRRRICSIPKFDAEDLERTMLVPSVQILDRFDFRSLLDFLLMRLRSACDSSWMSSLPDFQHVGISFLHFQNCFVFLDFLRCSEDILIQFSCCKAAFPGFIFLP